MKNTFKISIVLLLCLAVAAGFCVSCFAGENDILSNDSSPKTKNGIETIAQLDGKKIGVQTGVLYEDLIKDTISDEEWMYYKLPNDMIAALEYNNIDAYLIEEVGYYAQHYEHPELVKMKETAGYCDFAVIVGNNDKQPVLFEQLQEFIHDRKEDGWLDSLYDYWVKNWNPNTCKINTIPETTGENGTVIIAIEGGYEPFSYESNGKYSGYDVEFMMNFCAAYGYNWDFQAMEFDAIAIGAIAGKYDFGMNIVVDEERAEASVLSDPYYRCDIVFVLESADSQAGENEDNGESELEKALKADTSLIGTVKYNFYKTFIKEGRWKLFAEGMGTTSFITVCSLLFGTLLGFAIYMACRHGNPIANGITNGLTWFISGLPTVVFLMILNFVVFGKAKIAVEWISIVGFALIFGCNMFDMLCVGCNAIPKGQTEASRALGYSDKQCFFKIILPQAAKHFLPIYQNDMISLLKETSVVGYIAVMDLTKMGDLVRSRTYSPFFALIAVAIIYVVLEGILTAIMKAVQNKVNTRRRSDEKVLKGIKPEE